MQLFVTGNKKYFSFERKQCFYSVKQYKCHFPIWALISVLSNPQKELFVLSSEVQLYRKDVWTVSCKLSGTFNHYNLRNIHGTPLCLFSGHHFGLKPAVEAETDSFLEHSSSAAAAALRFGPNGIRRSKEEEDADTISAADLEVRFIKFSSDFFQIPNGENKQFCTFGVESSQPLTFEG